MSENVNGAPPAPNVNADVAFALHTLEIANNTLALMAGQLQKFAVRSPKCAQVAQMFGALANATGQMHAEMLREAASGVVIAQPGDVPPRRLQ